MLSLTATHESPFTALSLTSTPSLIAALGWLSSLLLLGAVMPLCSGESSMEIIAVPTSAKINKPAAAPVSDFQDIGFLSFFCFVTLFSFNRSLMDLLKGIV